MILLLVMILSRVYLWEIITVSGHSMDPTLQDKEHLLLIKTKKIVHNHTVVADEKDQLTNKTTIVIKRVIGLPGDVISYNKDILTRNGKEISEPYLDEFKKMYHNKTLGNFYEQYPKNSSKTTQDHLDAFSELAKTRQAFTTDKDGNTSFSITVPKNSVYLLGDNRLLSSDSRYFGSLPMSTIEGKINFSIKF